MQRQILNERSALNYNFQVFKETKFSRRDQGDQ